ncbi:sugar-transfer associated ATP-grasp domain-containing protein [Winogradskyella bathintestinalis]|uniref:Sugar-transfer associated ATP-grasp domain-containing protein n=1 Tax=Winogradskyella bathintestinalis TaxID=3035208 RepID=A0ABT7ZXL6_9FLAO|nr:sugar-transfer associated ATP-grasp domain-containing protein [Winogradskyella bathintestinalis]MDN3493740.1 sugar-transfer associated ATP-grasp domain-containing protein [Winogradskyella bathintestinalis]
MGIVKHIAKNMIEKGKMFVFHKEQNDYARNVLKTIERDKGKLDPKNRKLCIDYANDTFGSEIYAPWLHTYCAFAGDFKEGWIPDNFYGEIVVPQINGEYGQISNRSALIGKLVKESQSLDICYFVNQLFLNLNNEVLNEELIRKLLFTENKKVVYKLEDSRQGKGIYFFDKNTFQMNEIKKLGNGVFQKYIDQHPFFSEFTNSSVATIRITSTCDLNGNIDVKAGYLRFGREKDTHVKSDSAMKIALNIKNGQLCEEAYFPNWVSTKHLPGSNFLFAGKTLPSFHDCINEVKRMHNCIPFIRSVGWDIIVDKDNKVRLIELNGGHNSITFNETIQGPCFKGLNWESLNKTKP